MYSILEQPESASARIPVFNSPVSFVPVLGELISFQELSTVLENSMKGQAVLEIELMHFF